MTRKPGDDEMNIAVSSCLLGEKCKYNGSDNYNKRVVDFIRGHNVIPICPEILGGLPTPRESAEIVDGMVRLEDGTSVDKEFRIGAKRALKILLENDVELVILQSRSPSCGVNSIYDGSFSGKLIQGQGVFTELLKNRNINVVDVEDL